MKVTVGQLRAGYYALTALNTLASSYYFNYLFFFLRDRFAFNDKQNLAVAALHGGLYIVAAWQCGKFAQRNGFDRSLQIGFAGLFLCMVAGAFATSAWAHVVILACYTVVLLFIWPALEALTIEHAPADRVPHAIGVYNCTWATAGALSYFTGGPLYDWLGVGAVFWLPAAIFLAELVFVVWLARSVRLVPVNTAPHVAAHSGAGPVVDRRQATTFLTLAWIANPCSYVAIYTLFAVMPTLAITLGLSPAKVGLFCSIWLFARVAAFVWLWHWPGWHYRFDWLAGGFVVLIVSFATMVMATTLSVIVAAQVAFGAACGIAYYSSLFYSMDVGETKAEHGGLHEAAIGAGICGGPAIGALSVHLFPAQQNASGIAVTALLAVGFLSMIVTWARGGGR